MDQSISIMALAGFPLIIHFYPELSAEPVRFANLDVAPVFVIANTLVTADKHVTAPTNYNLRVVETRLAAALLAKMLGLPSNQKILTLREVQEMYIAKKGLEAQDTSKVLLALLEAVESHFQKSLYSRDQVAKVLGISVRIHNTDD